MRGTKTRSRSGTRDDAHLINAAQNLTRSSRRATVGRPATGSARDTTEPPAAVPEHARSTSMIEVLRRPVESAQFRSAAFVATLKDHGLAGSMGRVDACGDDAAMESFFALLQRTSWTGNAGLPASNCAWRSSPGSKRPITGAPATTSRPPHTHRIRDNQPGRRRRLNHPGTFSWP
jgi:hypothetical protein